MFFNYNNNQSPPDITGQGVLMERYIGKRPELIQIEHHLEKLHKKIKDKSFSLLNNKLNTDITMKEINRSEENKNIEKLFKKLFRLKEFELMWVKTSVPNAYTVAKTMQVLDKDFRVDKKTGVDFNKHLSVYVGVNTGIITLSKMTPNEVLAIILHEIGHNFYQSAFQYISSINPFNPLSTVFAVIMTDVIDIRRDFMRYFSIKDKIAEFLKLNKVKTIIEEIMVISNIFSLSTLQLMADIMNGKLRLRDEFFIFNGLSPRMYALYSVEKHADSFAVDYGYGVELASALNKLDQRVDSIVYDIPLFGYIKDFESLLVDITFQTLSGYPTMHNRQVSALKRLKKAQSDPNLPPSLKKELDRQVKEMEAYYENYMSIQNKENQKRIFTWTYRKMLDTFFGGVIDMRELLHKLDGAYKEDWGDLEK